MAGEYDPKAKPLLRFPAFLLCAFMVSCLAMVLLARLSLVRSREQYQRRAEITAQNLCTVGSSCKKIRDDQGYWNQIEAYLMTPTEAEFTHGICPDCAKSFFPDYRSEKETTKGLQG